MLHDAIEAVSHCNIPHKVAYALQNIRLEQISYCFSVPLVLTAQVACVFAILKPSSRGGNLDDCLHSTNQDAIVVAVIDQCHATF